MFRSKSFDDLMILVRDFSYKNNYKILVALTLALPLYWIIVGIYVVYIQKGGDGWGNLVFLFLFPFVVGFVIFSIAILPVRLQDKFRAVFSSLILGFGALSFLEGNNPLDLLFWNIPFIIFGKFPFGLVVLSFCGFLFILYFLFKYFTKKRNNLESMRKSTIKGD